MRHERPVHLIGVVACGNADPLHQIGRQHPCHRLFEIDLIGLLFVWKHSHIELVVDPTRHDFLVDDPHRRPDFDFMKQALDVFRVEMDAAMADIAADAIGLVGAMEIKARPAQAHRQVAHRIVRAGRNIGRQLRPFFPDRRRHRPAGIDLLADDPGDAERGQPALDAGADRIGLDPAATRRKIKHALLGEIEDDAVPRPVGQQIESRHGDALVGPRKPGIDPRIDAHELGVPDVVAARDVKERVLLLGGIIAEVADGDLPRLEGKLLGGSRKQRGRRRRQRGDRRPDQTHSHHANPTETRRMLMAPPGIRQKKLPSLSPVRLFPQTPLEHAVNLVVGGLRVGRRLVGNLQRLLGGLHGAVGVRLGGAGVTDRLRRGLGTARKHQGASHERGQNPKLYVRWTHLISPGKF